MTNSIVSQGGLYIAERSVADCAEAQPVELWRTDPVTPTTTWNSRPQRRELLSTALGGGDAECPGYLTWDITGALAKLAKRGETTLTVEIRLPHGVEGDLSHGRKLGRMGMNVAYNYAPTVTKAGLEYPQWACGTKENPTLVGPRSYSLMVQGDDADQNDSTYNGQFAAWPVGHKDQRVERMGGGSGSHLSKIDWEMSQYPHGTVVAWKVRATTATTTRHGPSPAT